jgi:hypothetical protein|tara:strand:+ start:94 stop:339 length:246 start_codon:yes stop_codon:yes gene_type:complete
MSKQPDEIEEGEIEQDDYSEDGSMIEVDQGEEVDFTELLGTLFATDNGDTVCSALVDISTQMQVQNKILVKILAQLQNMKN